MTLTTDTDRLGSGHSETDTENGLYCRDSMPELRRGGPDLSQPAHNPPGRHRTRACSLDIQWTLHKWTDADSLDTVCALIYGSDALCMRHY